MRNECLFSIKVVNQICPSEMIGDKCPSSETRTLHATLSVSLQVVGRPLARGHQARETEAAPP